MEISRLTPSITCWTSWTSENPSLSELEMSKVPPTAAVSTPPAMHKTTSHLVVTHYARCAEVTTPFTDCRSTLGLRSLPRSTFGHCARQSADCSWIWTHWHYHHYLFRVSAASASQGSSQGASRPERKQSNNLPQAMRTWIVFKLFSASGSSLKEGTIWRSQKETTRTTAHWSNQDGTVIFLKRLWTIKLDLQIVKSGFRGHLGGFPIEGSRYETNIFLSNYVVVSVNFHNCCSTFAK